MNDKSEHDCATTTDLKIDRIAFLTSAHPWSDTRIFLKEAASLAAAGYDITLVARRESSGVVNGVKCEALPAPANRLSRMLVTPFIVFRKALAFDVCHFHDPELIPIGLLLKLCGKKVIYDVHEDLPRQVLVKHWIPQGLRRTVSRVVEAIEHLAAPCFDRIVAATPTIASRFPPSKTFLVRNYPILSDETTPPPPYEDRKPWISYVGVISPARGALQMVQAFSELRRPGTELHLAGIVSPSDLAQELQSHPNVVLHGVIDRNRVNQLLNASKLGLVVLLPSQNYLDSLPTKLFEYMYAGIPVIASNFPLWRQFVEDIGAGLMVDPTNSTDIAEAMARLLDNPEEAREMGERGRKAVIAKFRWSEEACTLTEMYRALLRG